MEMFKSDTLYFCVLSFHISEMVEIPRYRYRYGFPPPFWWSQAGLELVVHYDLLILHSPPPKC